MFFIGATGPVVTVLLTLILPFFLLIAKKPEIHGNVRVNHQVYEKTFEVTSGTEVTRHFQADLALTQNSWFSAFLLFKEIAGFPLINQPSKKLLFILNDSGNKAPPAFCI